MHSDTSSIASLVRAADSLLTRLDNPSELPTDLLDLTNDILLRSYPPSPREVVKSVWLLRTLTNLISGCEDSAEVVFRNIGQGVSAWIADPCRAVSEDYVQEVRLFCFGLHVRLLTACVLSLLAWSFVSGGPHSCPDPPNFTLHAGRPHSSPSLRIHRSKGQRPRLSRIIHRILASHLRRDGRT